MYKQVAAKELEFETNSIHRCLHFLTSGLFLMISEKGFCVPTVFLWLLFVYIEASIRLKEFKAHLDLKHLPFHLDLCRPFAAHCIGKSTGAYTSPFAA